MANPLRPYAGGHHHPEPVDTVLAGAQAVKMRSGSQRHHLLVAYAQCDDPLGMNRWEAAVATGLTTATPWMRVGELERDGCLELTTNDLGQILTRPGRTEAPQQLLHITAYGRAVLRAHG